MAALASGKICLRGIEFYAHGGVSSEEKAVGQRYLADLEMVADLSRAAATDNLEDTVSYAEAFYIVVDTAQSTPFNLLESLAWRIASQLIESLPVQSVTIELNKLLPPIKGTVASAGVQLTVQANEVKRS